MEIVGGELKGMERRERPQRDGNMWKASKGWKYVEGLKGMVICERPLWEEKTLKPAFGLKTTKDVI